MTNNTPEFEYQMSLIEEMVQRRMANSGQSRDEAIKGVTDYLLKSYDKRLDDEHNYDTSGK